ncbi:MAG TPA: M2 family metallopeptidase [Phycisphaerae bacterium]|jgi:peptidyl-dipeptidase A|nr:M2 family metallopeptidase [Phycisphaerae bacterium]HOJ54251.1 M2 family metallopeptidase [Phycisphaerae bacterium]HOL26722.1 M2 family metallopeptidase [Phycisphaerae bacterium]HPP20608.1 M2 family metallopeptidase [Phycisphaerae bacterium]HPU34648.1 M2 family metallopeptidase [Phycisphaerae bacterium]
MKMLVGSPLPLAATLAVVLCVVIPPLRALGQDASPAPAGQSPAGQRAAEFIARYEQTIRPLETARNLADWNAAASGKDEDYKAAEEAQNRLDAALANPAEFAALKQIRDDLKKADPKPDPLAVRQIDLIYLEYLGKQVDPELLKRITAKSTAITQAFNVYRAEVNGRKLPDSEVEKILKENRDSQYRRAVWEASKGVGAVVEKDLKELVALRNEAARKLGFTDYYDMELRRSEMSREQVLKLFDALHDLTHGLFREAKREIDARLAADYSIQPDALRPWHYHDRFFQEPPDIYDFDFDPPYAKADVVKLAGQFYTGLGLPVDDVLARSDLYERPGKYPHAMCTFIDRENDIRVMANVVPNERWMSTMLHELGHAAYDKYMPKSLPYVVRTPAHTFTTEAIAMLFERFARQPGSMRAMGLEVADPVAVARAEARSRRDQILIFAAWTQVMVRFESAMYQQPDQDLNTLWWDLVEKYQLVRRPEGRNAPDYASKIHIVSAPAYYHAYMMGQMFASQLHRTIRRDVLQTDDPTPVYNNRKEIGEFLKTKVFAPGATLRWNELVRHATGEDLNPKAMMEELQAAAHDH